jgi:hypothetical protein
VRAKHFGQRQHQVRGRRARGERADGSYADDDRLRKEHRLPEHRGLGLDPADAPSQHAEAVDHRGVRIRPDERVRERRAVSDGDHLA